MQNINKYQHRGLPFSSWLYRIAINELNQYFRSQKRYRTINIETAQLGNILRDIQYEDREDEYRRMIDCMKRLSSGDYLLIEMRYFEGRPFREIGEILEITENNAKVKTYRALDKLKRIF
jgi:RNA polymerase sigma-70 factor (ECF subfamily)